ncbi:MAG: hypothetical protein QXY99_05740 [Thermoproteota archaeon]
MRWRRVLTVVGVALLILEGAGFCEDSKAEERIKNPTYSSTLSDAQQQQQKQEERSVGKILEASGLIPSSQSRQSQVGTEKEEESNVDTYESVEQILNRMLLKIGEIETIKKKARIYRSHIEREPIPRGRKREVVVPLDRPEIRVNCHVNYGTIIELPGKASKSDIALWDQQRFSVQVYDDRFILIQPNEPFKATNMTVFLDKGKEVLHFLLVEDELAKDVDYHLVVKLVPNKHPAVEKLIRWIANPASITREDMELYGIVLSMKSSSKRGSDLYVKQKIHLRRPEVIKAFVVGSRSGAPIDPSYITVYGDVLYHGNLEGTGDYFVIVRGEGGSVVYGGQSYHLQ